MAKFWSNLKDREKERGVAHSKSFLGIWYIHILTKFLNSGTHASIWNLGASSPDYISMMMMIGFSKVNKLCVSISITLSIQQLSFYGGESNFHILTNTPDAPRANALKTSVPRRIPPSRKTGIFPCAAFTTYSRQNKQKLN